MSYVPESDICVKSYDHSIFSRASVVQFRACRWVMFPNRTSVWNVMTIRFFRELPLFNFECLDELCPRIEQSSENLWPFEFLESFRCSISCVWIYYVPESDICVKSYDHSNISRASVVQFQACRWVMSPYRTFVWKLLTIRISRELPLFHFERLDILCPRIGHPCERLWPLKFFESFRCSISSVSIYYFPESNIRVKTYDHSNFSRASVVPFRATRYIMSLNRTSVWKVLIIQICRVLPLFNFERLDILFSRIEHPSEMLWPFEFLESFRCSISSVSMSYVPNRTSVWNVMTTQIFREHPLFNFERLDILCLRIGHLCENLWPFEFLESFRCSILSV